MSRREFDSWLLCATPRTGSTLLCGLLDSSGVAGHPASYFNRRGLHNYATSWQITQPAGGRIDPAYVEAALGAGTTPNGVFAARVMAESRPQLVVDLAATADRPTADLPTADLATTTDHSRVTELELLTSRFGRLRFVHLRRLDTVAPAVSWAKSLQTHYWHPGEPIEPDAEEPHYDEDLIERLVGTIERYEADWTAWFTKQQIDPFEVTYEQLSADPKGTARRVLQFLDLQLPDDQQLVVRHRRQADQTNADWIHRFHAR